MENRGRLSDDKSGEEREHTIIMKNREHVKINGVLGVKSFDEREIILDTEMGTLALRGEGLQVDEISLDDGNFTCWGKVTGMQYQAGGKPGRAEGGFLSRLLH